MYCTVAAYGDLEGADFFSTDPCSMLRTVILTLSSFGPCVRYETPSRTSRAGELGSCVPRKQRFATKID